MYEQAKKQGELIGDWSIYSHDPWIKYKGINSYLDLINMKSKLEKIWADTEITNIRKDRLIKFNNRKAIEIEKANGRLKETF